MMDKTKESPDHDTQLQLEMGMTAFDMLRRIKDVLEAATYGEVIRRSLQLYSHCDVDLSSGWEKVATRKRSDEGIKRLHVRIPPRTRSLLEDHRSEKGVSYSVVVTEALLLLAQVLRDQGRLEGGSSSESDDQPCDDSDLLLLTA